MHPQQTDKICEHCQTRIGFKRRVRARWRWYCDTCWRTESKMQMPAEKKAYGDGDRPIYPTWEDYKY